MRMSASWFGFWTHRIQGRGAIDPRPESGLPSNRHPDRIECAVVLRAVKVWPGKGGACGKVGATANLDSSCARRLCNIAGRGEETGFQIEQRNRSRKIAALKPLDKKDPIQGCSLAEARSRAMRLGSRTQQEQLLPGTVPAAEGPARGQEGSDRRRGVHPHHRLSHTGRRRLLPGPRPRALRAPRSGPHRTKACRPNSQPRLPSRHQGRRMTQPSSVSR